MSVTTVLWPMRQEELASQPTSDSVRSSDLGDLGECDRYSVSSSVLCMHVYTMHTHHKKIK